MSTPTSTPKVTFFVPTYNYGHYLAECVDSILAQSYTDFELIILDDCSPDNTPEVAETLAQKDNRVIYVRHPENKGHMANYNHGIAMARGDWLWCVSADDRLASPDVLTRYMDAFSAHPSLGLAFCRAQVIDENSEPVEKWVPRLDYPMLDDEATVYSGRAFFKKILQENFVPVIAALARKSCYEKVGNYNPRLTHTGDWYLWMQFALDWDVFYDPEALVYYRVHSQNMHRTYDNDQHVVDNTLACYEELMQYLDAQGYGMTPKLQTRLATIRYKRKQNLGLAGTEHFLHTFVRPFVSLNR